MFADAFSEENLLRDERHGWCRTAVPPALDERERENQGSGKLARTPSPVNDFPALSGTNGAANYNFSEKIGKQSVCNALVTKSGLGGETLDHLGASRRLGIRSLARFTTQLQKTAEEIVQ